MRGQPGSSPFITMDTVTIIAEAGVNHNGKPELARRLVDVAADAGADYVKFQTFRTDRLVSPQARKAGYQQGSGEGETQYEMLRELELSERDHRELMAYCRKRDIGFLSTPFDEESAAMLAGLNLDYLKIPSGELTNRPFLEFLAGMDLPIILSTGMATLREVEQALEILRGGPLSLEDITVLHCNTAYPTPFDQVNLRAMVTMREHFGVRTGYSDHTPGIEVPVAAAALGARIIEKHFTLDRQLPGPDHAASLEPEELTRMVMAVRHIEGAMGHGRKEPTDSEKENIAAARKSIHAAKKLPAGRPIREGDLVMLRPGDGISPMRLNSVVSRKPTRDIEAGEKLNMEDIS